MSILIRIRRILSANINELIDKAENPEKMINQMIRDMEENVREVRQEVAAARASLKGLENKWKKHEDEAQQWEKRAEMALKKSNETLAKEALKKKKEHFQTAREFQNQAESQKENVEVLTSSLKQLEDKMDEAKEKKTILFAKKRIADASISVHKKVSGRDEEAALHTWNRMQEKIEEREVKGQAAMELTKEQFSQGDTATDLDVELELEALKEKIAGGKPEKGS